ncbi:SWIM-type domain-containing protein [Mycena venus]|uniref:SWIM-type domain-containing protein n=1 Tax=Mycena venus TaxID=2733690 RepID=A0A8H6Z049_9AGAR|nr:SWIM-type domain-containing protein [Mycena venus]
MACQANKLACKPKCRAWAGDATHIHAHARNKPIRAGTSHFCKPKSELSPTSLARAINARATGTAAPKATKGRKAAVKTDDAAASSSEDEAAASSGEDEEGKEETKTRRTFCPASYRESIINMMERHYCAHPLLSGSAHPSLEGTKRWAVTQMYKFCVEHGLREVWAYLWENWYRNSRWELWARSVHPEIPVLKTTMILESHWRRIKHDFLHHFHMPRCDLLAWILIVKLAPNYYRTLDRLLTDTGRYRELPSWRQNFKKVWRKLEKTPITLTVNPAYKTDAKKMVCTCQSLPISRFLLCKHTVQGVEPVPPVFFFEVKRQRMAPFWVHPSLRPLSNDSGAAAEPSNEEEERHESPSNAAIDSGDDSDSDSENLVDTQIGGN